MPDNHETNTCPPFQNFAYPLLSLALNGEIRVRASADVIAEQLNLSAKAKAETTRSGNAVRYIDRTYWSATYLRQAGLLKSSRLGWVVITDEGKQALEKFDGTISRRDLMDYETFAQFANVGVTQQQPNNLQEQVVSTDLTPEERISEALTEIEDTLIFEILERIQSAPPSFFESIVVQLLVSMGYGNANQARITGQAGDNGIDGVIDQDQLGLDRVYIQAKRYDSTNKVGAEAIRNFAGSLNLHQASKGLFFTTSSFTTSAVETAERVTQRIVLIDGNRLAGLMIANQVGCSPKQSLHVMRLNEDFFDY